jgi:hypothetical protein
MADELGWEVVDPPRHAWEAKAAADRASEEARRLDGQRRALPRRKASPKLDKAVAFVRTFGVTTLTKDVLKKAKRKGITEGTLRRAIKTSEEKTTDLSPDKESLEGPGLSNPV